MVVRMSFIWPCSFYVCLKTYFWMQTVSHAHSHPDNAKQCTFDLHILPALLIYSNCNAVHFHISIEKAPVNPQGYARESPSLSTLRWSCFCSPVQPRYQWRAGKRKSTQASWGLQRAMMARPQTVWSCSTFVISQGHGGGGTRLQHWQQYKRILMGRFNSVAVAAAGTSCF